jgi:8-oxo-dGTP diphosphatase
MSKVQKAGCILLNLENKTIALVYRKKQNDYSFPKGHLEDGESLVECAIRETAEETKFDCEILEEEPVYIETYITPSGEDVEMYYFISKYIGSSNNNSDDTHPTLWIPYEDVYETLSYDSLKKVWNIVKDKVKYYFNKDMNI